MRRRLLAYLSLAVGLDEVKVALERSLRSASFAVTEGVFLMGAQVAVSPPHGHYEGEWVAGVLPHTGIVRNVQVTALVVDAGGPLVETSLEGGELRCMTMSWLVVMVAHLPLQARDEVQRRSCSVRTSLLLRCAGHAGASGTLRT